MSSKAGPSSTTRRGTAPVRATSPPPGVLKPSSSDPNATVATKIAEELKRVKSPATYVEFFRFAFEVSDLLNSSVDTAWLLLHDHDARTDDERAMSRRVAKVILARLERPMLKAATWANNTAELIDQLYALAPPVWSPKAQPPGISMYFPTRAKDEDINRYLERVALWNARYNEELEGSAAWARIVGNYLLLNHYRFYQLRDIAKDFELARPGFEKLEDVFQWFRQEPLFASPPVLQSESNCYQSQGSSRSLPSDLEAAGPGLVPLVMFSSAESRRDFGDSLYMFPLGC